DHLAPAVDARSHTPSDEVAAPALERRIGQGRSRDMIDPAAGESHACGDRHSICVVGLDQKRTTAKRAGRLRLIRDRVAVCHFGASEGRAWEPADLLAGYLSPIVLT